MTTVSRQGIAAELAWQSEVGPPWGNLDNRRLAATDHNGDVLVWILLVELLKKRGNLTLHSHRLERMCIMHNTTGITGRCEALNSRLQKMKSGISNFKCHNAEEYDSVVTVLCSRQLAVRVRTDLRYEGLEVLCVEFEERVRGNLHNGSG